MSRPMTWFAAAGIAVSLATALATFALWRVTTTRDGRVAARGEELTRLKQASVFCGRRTQATFRCAMTNDPGAAAVLRQSGDACDSAWDDFHSHLSLALRPDGSQIEPRLARLRALAVQIEPACGTITGIELARAARNMALELDEAFDHADAHALDLLTTARAEWRQSLRWVGRLAVAAGAWATALAAGLAFFTLRMRGASAQLESITSRAQELDAFAARAAHDLRQILTPLPLIAGSLIRAHGDPGRVDELAGRLERTSRKAARMIESLLAFARIGHGKQDVTASVRPVVQEALEDAAVLVESVGAKVTTDIADGEVQIDPTLLYAVVTNLTSNALKFMRGCAVRELHLRGWIEEAKYSLSIEDTGPGIPPEKAGQIFEPFYRAAPEAAPGSGLGLVTVRRIVEAHGGRIDLESKAGSGTKVTVCFLLAPRAPPPGPPGERQEQQEELVQAAPPTPPPVVR